MTVVIQPVIDLSLISTDFIKSIFESVTAKEKTSYLLIFLSQNGT